jgi:two-component system, chemotaxis family, CheB/CheR fusion protein
MYTATSNGDLPTAKPRPRVRAPSYIVGIGASAGGLESLEQMFQNTPTSSGMAFVVIQHLSPDFKSMMSELLARSTSMRIVVVEDGVRVEANVIYLMPPKKEMIIADGCLHLSDKDRTRGLTLPIDHFLESLAREMGEKSIAVILSGSGTDGTRGIEEVSQSGGLVISESLDTAKFDGMPSSAQATDLVDVVLPPTEIGQALLSYSRDPSSLPRGKPQRRTKDASLRGIDAIMQLFRNVYDIDFASYKDSTVLRRIRRRVDMSDAETFDQYAELLEADPGELHLLYGDLLIGVTQFFRDPGVFQFLKAEVIPEVITRRDKDEPVRVWVAGCATGEEAYSVAIAFQEVMRATGCQRRLKVFATDVNKRSLEQASRGVFASEVLQEVDKPVLERYLTPRTDGFQIRPELRQMIVFAPHNVLRDAPFTDLDFVSCRNMLIYLRPAAQRRAISLLHYGLGVGGVLLLGGSETTGELAGEFDVISDRHRLYRKNRDVRLTHNLRSPLTSADSKNRGMLPQTMADHPPPGAVRTRQVHDELLGRYMPPSILIDSSRSVIDTFAGAEKLLRFPTRQPSLDILDLVGSDVRTTLSGVISRAMKSQSTSRFGKLALAPEGTTRLFNLAVEPLGGEGDQACYLITFKPVEVEGVATSENHGERCVGATTSYPAGAEDELDVSRDQIRQLEDDLRYTRENLQATIEELETSNEELQATNEELIASNEELQSTNEELHSLNEELYSVNSEHQRKIEELAELNRDMNHLLENTDVATVFLDSELRIRRFTSKVREVFELINEDIGRSIHVFSSKLRIDDLVDRLQHVLQTGEAYDREVLAADKTTYLMRLLPYRPDECVSGVVMMWVDVSSLEALRGRVHWLSAIVESTSDAIIGQDLSGVITSWNQGAEQLYGYAASEIIGQDIALLVPENRRHEVVEYRDRILRGDTVLSSDTVRLRRDGNTINVSLTVSPVFDANGDVIGISKIARDISQRIKLEREVRHQVQQRERFLAMLSHELRNPLNAVSSATAILARDDAPAPAKAASAATIGRQVEIIAHLLGDLLDVARIAENRINLKFEPLDIRELVPIVQEIVQPEVDRHQCAVDFDLPEQPLVVNGDRTRLIQVQVNLIHNAAKYSETLKPIRVKLRREDQHIHLTVSDEGRGIPRKQLESIFEPFAQLDRSRTKSDGGLGLGLTLAKSLVELHGGSIYAESDGEGRGSALHVWLPRMDDNADVLSLHRVRLTADNPGPQDNPPVRPLHICVVEDLDDSRDMIKTLLEFEGHRVTTASNGEDAINLLTTDPPDLALVDIGLPGISGYEVAREVRERLPTAEVTLIALTGYGQPADVNQALATGFDAHVVKPLGLAALRRLCGSIHPGGRRCDRRAAESSNNF